MSEPKGYCPYCDVPGWEICSHFTGYLRDGMVFDDIVKDKGPGRPRSEPLRPLRAGEVAISTPVSIRVYKATI